jgi:hypothetical protein
MTIYKGYKDAYNEINKVFKSILNEEIGRANITSIKLDLLSKHEVSKKAILEYIKDKVTESNGLIEIKGDFLVKVQD